ncbi:hypothetical protein [Salinifilum ghardaiensis]
MRRAARSSLPLLAMLVAVARKALVRVATVPARPLMTSVTVNGLFSTSPLTNRFNTPSELFSRFRASVMVCEHSWYALTLRA